jgi:hypothetical protein
MSIFVWVFNSTPLRADSITDGLRAKIYDGLALMRTSGNNFLDFFVPPGMNNPINQGMKSG